LIRSTFRATSDIARLLNTIPGRVLAMGKVGFGMAATAGTDD
jgi:hypothetical protein